MVGFQTHDKNMLLKTSTLEPVPCPSGIESYAENVGVGNHQMGTDSCGQNVQEKSHGSMTERANFGQNIQEGNDDPPSTVEESGCNRVQVDSTAPAQMTDSGDKIAGRNLGPRIVPESCDKSVDTVAPEEVNMSVQEGDELMTKNLDKTSQQDVGGKLQYRSQIKKVEVRLSRNSVDVPLSEIQDSNVLRRTTDVTTGENGDVDINNVIEEGYALSISATEREGSDAQVEGLNSGMCVYIALVQMGCCGIK